MYPEWVYQECPEISTVHRDAALARQAQLTKPAGSLGRIEHLACELAALPQTERARRARNVGREWPRDPSPSRRSGALSPTSRATAAATSARRRRLHLLR